MILRRFAACGISVGVGLSVYSLNERVVAQRAARLDRLQDCATHCSRERVSSTDLETQATFNEPIVIEGLIDSWPARDCWSFEALRQRIGHALVDCGSSSGGVPFYLVAANSSRSHGRHDLALYVFDSDFEEESGKACLLSDVGPLDSLSLGDVFRTGAAGQHDDRPAWRWLLAGPPGSGTLMHQDPWSYSSWNASIVGAKRWVLFPPTTPYATLHPPRDDILSVVLTALFGRALPRGATAFMEEVLPTLRGQGLGEIELVQRPGEVVAFPAGWWHAVVNLDATLAITESYGRAHDLPAILAALRKGGLAGFAAVIEDEVMPQLRP